MCSSIRARKEGASNDTMYNNDANQNIITVQNRGKKHVITDLMCRISFITIHGNVWLDFSLRYCHLLCSFVFMCLTYRHMHARTHRLWMEWIRCKQKSDCHTMPCYMWFSEYYLVFFPSFLWHYCDLVICVATFCGFFFFLKSSGLGCAHVFMLYFFWKRRKDMKSDLKRTIVSPHSI